MMRSFFTKKIIISMVIVAFFLIGGFLAFRNGNGVETAIVKTTDLIQEVATTGKVKPETSVDMGFDKSGRVARVYVSIGQAVKQGDLLASLDESESAADLQKARAVLSEEESKLREVQTTTPSSYNEAYRNLSAVVSDAFVKADNAVRNRVDQFFKTPTTNPQFDFYITDGNFINYFTVPSDLKIDINTSRKEVEVILVNWRNRVVNFDQTNALIESEKALRDLNTIYNFLNKVAEAVNTFTPAEYSYETTVTAYKTNIASARSEITTSISAVVAAKDKLNSAPTLSQSGQFENVLTQQAKVAQAEANVAAIEAAIGKGNIRAPFDGVVTKQDAEVGAAVTAGTPLISMASANQVYIEANISEIHIGKVKPGNLVSVNLDAFPDENFEGFISYVEPGDTIIDGVVNYKIRVDLKNPDPKIKNGLTANLKIETAKKTAVLAVPLYAVTREGEDAYVSKVVGKNTEKTKIKLGLIGKDGLVEVTSGLTSGDTIQFGQSK